MKTIELKYWQCDRCQHFTSDNIPACLLCGKINRNGESSMTKRKALSVLAQHLIGELNATDPDEIVPWQLNSRDYERMSWAFSEMTKRLQKLSNSEK
jgi:5-methylcytosine-specific restriction endonuclease McrA